MAIWTTTTTTTTTTITAATTTAAISQWHYCRVSIIVGPDIDRGFGRARRNCANERASDVSDFWAAASGGDPRNDTIATAHVRHCPAPSSH